MQIVLNECYGGFTLSDKIAKELNVDSYDESWELRTNPKLIEAVLKDTHYASGTYSHLCVEDIPDDATDWYLDEYDGYESILYVVDGKLYRDGERIGEK